MSDAGPFLPETQGLDWTEPWIVQGDRPCDRDDAHEPHHFERQHGRDRYAMNCPGNENGHEMSRQQSLPATVAGGVVSIVLMYGGAALFALVCVRLADLPRWFVLVPIVAGGFFVITYLIFVAVVLRSQLARKAD